MGYSILTQAELDNIDTNNIKIDGEVISYSEKSNNIGTAFIIEGDQFNEYTLSEMKQYIKDNWYDWNVPT